MTTIERESAIIDRMKLEADMAFLLIDNAKLRAQNDALLTQLFDCLQALCRSVRGQSSWKP